MSKNQKRKKVLKKMFLKSDSDHNALKIVFEFQKVVTMIFLGKNVGVFLVDKYINNGNKFYIKKHPFFSLYFL
jgi:hypothetical protein